MTFVRRREITYLVKSGSRDISRGVGQMTVKILPPVVTLAANAIKCLGFEVASR